MNICNIIQRTSTQSGLNYCYTFYIRVGVVVDDGAKCKLNRQTNNGFNIEWGFGFSIGNGES